jgi:hypothetical protein
LGRLALVVALAQAASLFGQTAPQTVTLSAGWNAVWLEVEPTYGPTETRAGQTKDPADVFTNPAIDIVATPKPLAGSVEFFAADPESIPSSGGVTEFNQDEWQQWKRVDPAGSSNLPAVFGNWPYLIHTTGSATVTLTLTGKVRFFRPKWTPDRYNLIGFGLEGTRTFVDFFGPSGTTHPTDRIFTLNPNGTWTKVVPSQAMASNKAYWIFSSGASNYMGPVALNFDRATSTGILDFAGPGDALKVGSESLDLKELTFTNLANSSATPTATAVSADPSLLLYRVTPNSSSLGYTRGNGFLAAFIPVPSQQDVTLTIGAKRTFTDDSRHISLYRIRASSTGASFYLPVSAIRSELQQPAGGGAPAGSLTGLWVGDVAVNRATSIVVNGAPTQPTTGTASLRIVMHSDSAGIVRLLSQVTLMQTKTGNPDGSGVPVLVVNPAKIPFFEGIKTRNGKRVGVRIESVAYDMPRSASAWSGPDLITFANRPPSLQEIYDFVRPMTGAIGQTVTATISLDPFHRSNPLRHVYHQDLGKGPKITRSMTIAFDPAGASGDVLSGTFTEVVQGLIKDNLTLTGRINLRRVSDVGTLQGL